MRLINDPRAFWSYLPFARRIENSNATEEQHSMLSYYSNNSQLEQADLSSVERRYGKIEVLKAILCRFAAFLLPSFARKSDEQSTYVSVLHRPETSSLDGLRGYAAIAVMNYHIFYNFQSTMFYGYGLPQQAATHCAMPQDIHENNTWLYQLPILRLFYTGTWSISVFFVISGFALSFKPLKLLRSSGHNIYDTVPATTTVVSSLLRRPFRLYGPPVTMTFVTMCVISLGGFENGRQVSNDPHWVSVIREVHHQRLDTFGLQFLDWLQQTWRMLDIFQWVEIHNRYDVHLWTIPTELRCSIAVFAILPVYVAIRAPVRRALMVILILYVYALDRWDVGLFYAGLLIADTAIGEPASLRDPKLVHISRRVFSKVLRFLLFGLGLLLLSAPDLCAEDTPGFEITAFLIPSSDAAPFRFLPNLGGILFVALLAHTRSSNRFVSISFNSNVPQYLGRISYSLYLVHGPLMHTLGYALFPLFWQITGFDETWRYVIGFLAAYLLLVVVIIWTADLFCRAVDEPFIRFAKSAETALLKR